MSAVIRVLRRAASAGAVLAAAVSVGACARAPAPAAPAPPAEPQSQFAAAPVAPGASVEGAAAELARAEDQMQRALALAGGAPVAPAQEKPSLPNQGAPAPPPPQAGPSKAPTSSGSDDERPDALSAADACSVACRALESMRRSTEQLCGLAGAGDARCIDANARVDRALARVRASCPACAR